MHNKASKKIAAAGFNRSWLFLSIAMPLVLLAAFMVMQFVDLDGIGWNHGFEHPLTGWDHLITMLAVGIWAAQLRGQAIWMLPASFVGVMSLGGLAGAAGISLPSVEGIILLSCAVFGVLITRRVRFSAKINVLIVAFFAFFHGFAHGQEISASASLISYTLGFMLATLLLHGAGILVAKLVVLSVTFMLTAMFSGAALAKASGADVNAATASAATKDVSQHEPAWFTSDQSGGSGHYQTFEDGRLRVDRYCPDAQSGGSMDAADIGLSGSVLPELAAGQPRNSSGMLKIAGDAQGLLATARSEHAMTGWTDFAVCQEDYCIAAVLQFKHLFPDINHTPGQHLLSNGVGLTSPPVASVVPASSHTVPTPRTAPIQPIAVHPLQSINAKFIIGEVQVQTVRNHGRNVARRDFSSLIQASVRTELFILVQDNLWPGHPQQSQSSGSLPLIAWSPSAKGRANYPAHLLLSPDPPIPQKIAPTFRQLESSA